MKFFLSILFYGYVTFLCPCPSGWASGLFLPLPVTQAAFCRVECTPMGDVRPRFGPKLLGGKKLSF